MAYPGSRAPPAVFIRCGGGTGSVVPAKHSRRGRGQKRAASRYVVLPTRNLPAKASGCPSDFLGSDFSGVLYGCA